MTQQDQDVPPELIEDLAALTARWQNSSLEPWLQRLPDQFREGLSTARYGDIPRWREALAQLPEIEADRVLLDRTAVGAEGSITGELKLQLEAALRGLHPWRKGPFNLFGVNIDTEWRSDCKWQRLLPGLAPLTGKRVLDVGCGSGYHCWRMLGAGASEVIGIEPTPLFVLQFKALQRYLKQPNIHIIPTVMEALPRPMKAFDTVFSMGVLYHRRSPLDHLLELRDALTSGGQLVLETLIVDGGADTVFTPEGRYARMGNVWFLPSANTLCQWLSKLGFKTPTVINIDQTSAIEQRSTEWMTFNSLSDFLDPNDRNRTVEGHPAPLRAIVTAYAP